MVFTDYNVVTMGDMTIAKFIESVLEETAVDSASNTGCMKVVISAVAIAVLDNVAYAPRKFGVLPGLEFTIGQYEGLHPEVHVHKMLAGNSEQLLPGE